MPAGSISSASLRRLGLHHDSNGNSAPTSGNVTVFDTSILLGANNQEQGEFQAFMTGTLNHRYRRLKPGS